MNLMAFHCRHHRHRHCIVVGRIQGQEPQEAQDREREFLGVSVLSASLSIVEREPAYLPPSATTTPSTLAKSQGCPSIRRWCACHICSDLSSKIGLTVRRPITSSASGKICNSFTPDILDVNGLTEPIVAENAIDELVMRPEENKNTIKAIIKTYTDTNGQADLMGVDFIRGKGEGQIFLLHGPPGTGKTLTAGTVVYLLLRTFLTLIIESVAEYTKRPLLSITAADLGHDPIEVERNLLRFFKNATSWDAIVLLDEADIYLERRSSKDLRRNSIVSSK
jgi:hypothetical protein